MRTRLEKELKGAREWLAECEAHSERNPTDAWVAGQVRHYRKRVKELEAQLATADES